MLKILTTEQIRAWDAYTIRNEPIASIDLMERACRAFVVWFTERFTGRKKIGVVCGTGNSGGDGLGIARMLREWEYPVRVWVVRANAGGSEDFKANFERLASLVEVMEVSKDGDPMALESCDILIDGLFGSGLSRPPEGVFAYAIDQINRADAIRIAIDIPSGLMADSHSSGSIVRADYTVTFQAPKLAMYLPGSYPYTGEWEVVDIGLKREYVKEVKASVCQMERKDFTRIRKKRLAFGHKGDYGRAVLISGSYGKMGAAVLSSRAALRSGVGLLTVHVPACGYTVMQTAVPEAMVTVDNGKYAIEAVPDLINVDVVGVGPGLGTGAATAAGLRR